MTESKKKWEQPELIVLVRSRPEEIVLGTCKIGESIGPLHQDAGCTSIEGACLEMVSS
jgi:hypothetical protein